MKSVNDDDDLLITTSDGIIIRMNVSDIRVSGRATQGVKVIRLDGNDSIADVEVMKRAEEEELIEDAEIIVDEQIVKDNDLIVPDSTSEEE